MNRAASARSSRIFSWRRFSPTGSCSARFYFRASLCPSRSPPRLQTKAQGVRAKLTSTPLEMAGEKIVPSVTRFFTAGTDAVRFLSGLLSGEIRQGGQVRSHNAPRCPDFLPQRNSGERDASAHSRAGGSKIADGNLSHQLAAREASGRPLHGASRGDWGGHAALRFRAGLSCDRAPACNAVVSSRARNALEPMRSGRSIESVCSR